MSVFQDGSEEPGGAPDPEDLRKRAIVCLSSAIQKTEADMVTQSTFQVQVVAARGGLIVYVTMRCRLEHVLQLESPDVGGTNPQARTNIYEAVRRSLSAQYSKLVFEARIGLSSEVHLPPPAMTAPQIAPAAAPVTPPAAAKHLGRLFYLPDFSKVWLAGVEYDLRGRTLARGCLMLMVERKAVDEKSSLDVKKDIHPYLEAHHGAISKEPRMHDYFTGKLDPLRDALFKAVGRNRRYYMMVL